MEDNIESIVWMFIINCVIYVNLIITYVELLDLV